MKKLLADIFPEDKERQDYFIALVVIALFIFGAFAYISPSRDAELELLSAEEAAEKLTDLEHQQLSFDEGIVTDIEGYRPYYDHRQKEIIYSNRTIKTGLATAAVSTPLSDAINNKKSDANDKTQEGEILTPEASTEPTKEAEIIIEEEFDEAAIQEEVPPDLDIDGNVIENEVDDELDTNTAAVEAEQERKRLATEARIEKERQQKLAEERAQREAKERAKRNSIGTLAGCHVIVGAFKNKKNAQGFKEKVVAKNFTVAIGNVRGKTYIGIPVDCTDKSEIKATQSRVNSAFEINSWVLKN